MKRRNFIQGTLAGSAVAVGAALFPHAVFAEWPKAAFEAKEVDAALQALLGSAEASDSGEIEVKAPDIAENGAVVPVQITTTLANIESISLIVEKNPVPLIASFSFPDPAMAEGFVSTRIKMGATSNVMAVVKAGGKLYKAAKEVKVTIGGCGG
jgi:sulfur-oxidizing protein SoxY